MRGGKGSKVGVALYPGPPPFYSTMHEVVNACPSPFFLPRGMIQPSI